MPPSCAMAIARRASVTVSMAADSSGKFRRMLRVSCVAEADFAGQDLGMGGDEQDVVEGERFLQNTHGLSLTQSGIIRARRRRAQTGGCNTRTWS